MTKNDDKTMNARITCGERNETGWIKGEAETAAGTYRFSAKVYDGPSRHGIRRGRASKLWISRDGRCAANYERGWDVRPTDAGAKAALEAIFGEFR